MLTELTKLTGKQIHVQPCEHNHTTPIVEVDDLESSCTEKELVAEFQKPEEVGMMRPWGLVKSCHLVKPISVSLVTGSYLTQQEGLPSLPLPSLQQSCEHYLACVEPIVEVDELKHTKELVVEFQKPGGVGEILQRSLERREYRTENWVSSTTTPITVATFDQIYF
ncbi:hypothetical protein PAMA_008870 [Pampus argenteus]